MGRRPLPARRRRDRRRRGLGRAAGRGRGAHPLGNFTINHYAGITVAPNEIHLDVVIDMAEIPTFQERQHMDTDGDGTVSDAEASRGARRRSAPASRPISDLPVGGTAAPLEPTSAAISVPGRARRALDDAPRVRVTSRRSPAPLAASTPITFADVSYPERIGWREIVASGDGVSLDDRRAAGDEPCRSG